MRAHLMGICGSGMSALAAWMAHRGHEVSGCDRDPSAEPWLADLGIHVETGHSPAHAASCEVLVHTAAVPGDHPELEAGRSSGALVLRRSEALAWMCPGCRVAAVAGAHGKTTTTAMTGWVLQYSGVDPTVLAGGKVPGWTGGFRPGGDEVVLEADEYDRAFLRIPHEAAAVTSFDLEHLECYGSEEALHSAFQIFLELTAPGGGVVVPVENPDLAFWASRIGRRVLSAGPGGDFDCVGRGASGWGETFDVAGMTGRLGIPGVHNLRNAATTLALTSLLGVDARTALDALDGFPGVGRRLERLGIRDGRLIVSDYAHHPREMAASISALRRAMPESRLAVIFEPHLFSRTARLGAEMGRALAEADIAFVLPIYPARESPVPGVDSGLVVSAAVAAGAGCSRCGPREAVGLARSIDADVVVFMGAGVSDSLARLALGDGR